MQVDDWAAFTDFADQFIAGLPLSSAGAHLGLISFATNVTVVQPLSGDKAAVAAARKTNMTSTMPKGKTNTHLAVDLAVAQFATNGRAGLPKARAAVAPPRKEPE